MKKRIIFTIILLIIGFGSFYIGFKPYEPVVTLYNNDEETETGIQTKLTEKSLQVTKVWLTLKVVNGVVNVLQSAQIGGSFFVEATVNPLEFLAPIDNTMDRISNLLLWALGAILLEKILLSISGYIIFLIVIPACAFVSILTLWLCKEKSKLHRILIASILICLVVPFAIPVSFQVSTFIEGKFLTNNVEKIIGSIENNGNTAESMEKEISGLKKIGTSIIKYMTNVKNLGNALINDMINYLIIFILTNIIIPILTVFGLYGITRYFTKMILER